MNTPRIGPIGLPLFVALFVALAAVGPALLRASAASDELAASDLPLKHIADIPLPGAATRLDYESYDPGRKLLFIAHLGDGEVIVFDAAASRVIGRITNVASVHGVLAIPELSRVYASATGTNEIVAIDEATLKIVARMPGGRYPDGMAYAPEAHKLYVSDETGETETVIDVRTNTRVATIPLGGEVGNTQYDPVSRHIFVNVQSRRQLVEIDPATDRIVARIGLAGAQGNHGLLIEPRQRLAFIACEGNDKLLVLDMRTMRVTASFDAGQGPDVLAFDPQLHLLYVAGEAGIVSMFKAEAGKVSKIGNGRIGPNAHIVAVDGSTHRVYLPLRNVQGSPTLRIMQPRD
ncbi:YncE family protein [Paraburkholderia terricola]|uniref:40-residue YVTN family beta-propeller repeat-containing protein n=1 Tax=Paraburkholderia terricola TaxID=169427 RepID=A0A1M6WS07_9BURK|nr:MULTISPECIES: YncE family protein [Paraburkholderia]SDP11086.1 40-residue YVTN family beta-propeller repeat-containing protein [Paraburkholderia sediminicola]SHK96434.1 40-residue YVTN family beta-propeller repeat-containing protein [Paraburkholderia terricola]